MVPKWTLTEGGPKVNIWSEGEYFGPKVYMNRMWIFFGPKVDILYRHLRTTPFGPCLGPKVNMDRRWTWSQGGQFLVRRWAIGPKVDMVRRWWSEGGCSRLIIDFPLIVETETVKLGKNQRNGNGETHCWKSVKIWEWTK